MHNDVHNRGEFFLNLLLYLVGNLMRLFNREITAYEGMQVKIGTVS